MATNENVWSWSTTAADNATADASIVWSEGQDPGTVNNSARGMMAAIAKMTDVQSGNITVGGSADAITITTGQTISSGHQALGFRICFRATATNTGATTVAVDGLAAVAIKRPNNDALSAGDIVSGAFHDIAFDGTNYRLLVPGATGTYGVLAGYNTWSGTNVFQGGTTVGDDAADTVVIKGTTVSAAMAFLLGSANAAAARSLLGLGTAAEYNIGTGGATVPLQSTNNLWTGGQSISVGASAVCLGTTHPTNATVPALYMNLTGADAASIPQVWFLGNAIAVGSITTNVVFSGGSTAYNTTSDDRLKRATTALADSGAIIDQLAPIRFRWGRDDGPEDFGFSAQALHAVVPQAVTPGRGEPGDRDFVPWMREHGRLEAILVAEIKALRARVAALEAG